MYKFTECFKKYDGKIVLNNLNKKFFTRTICCICWTQWMRKKYFAKNIVKINRTYIRKSNIYKTVSFHYIPEKSFALSLNSRQYLTHMGAFRWVRKKTKSNQK